MHDYGLGLRDMLKRGRNFGWFKYGPMETKKVILTNPEALKNTVTVSMVAEKWSKALKNEDWAYALSYFFVSAVVNAISLGNETADITDCFNRDMLASHGREMTKEEVWDALSKRFIIVSENAWERRVSVRA